MIIIAWVMQQNCWLNPNLFIANSSDLSFLQQSHNVLESTTSVSPPASSLPMLNAESSAILPLLPQEYTISSLPAQENINSSKLPLLPAQEHSSSSTAALPVVLHGAAHSEVLSPLDTEAALLARSKDSLQPNFSPLSHADEARNETDSEALGVAAIASAVR